jgi:hypothetical protein
MEQITQRPVSTTKIKEIEEDVLALVREEDQSRLLYLKDWEYAELWKGAVDAKAAEIELSEPIILTSFFVKLLDGRTLNFNSDIRSSVKGLKAKIGYKIGHNVMGDRLLFAGRILANDQSIDFNNGKISDIGKESTLHLMSVATARCASV